MQYKLINKLADNYCVNYKTTADTYLAFLHLARPIVKTFALGVKMYAPIFDAICDRDVDGLQLRVVFMFTECLSSLLTDLTWEDNAKSVA